MKDQRTDEEIYNFAAETPPLTNPRAPRTQPMSAAKAQALTYRSKKAQAAKADPETIKNLHLPMWLLAGGVAIETAAVLLRGGGANAALVNVGVKLIFGTAVMVVGVLLAARFRGIDLGRFWISVFKLSAISVAPAAAGDLLEPFLRIIPFSGLLGLSVEFILYFALLGALFDLDESDTWFCVCVIFLVGLAIYFTLSGIGAAWG